MFGKRIALFKLFGFQVSIDLSWFLLAILITWSLARGYFPGTYQDLVVSTYWMMGLAGALGLFGSLILHEFAHSWVARHHGVEMRGITLFIFGGVAEMTQEPDSPRTEFLIAIAGPIASILIAVTCYGGKLMGDAAGWPLPVGAVLGYLALINLILVAFNLVPAFPLDGGRVLRSILWRWRGNLRWATRVSSRIGSAFGAILIGLGLLSVIAGNLIGGIWWFLIGLFVRGAAQSSYQQLLLRQILEGEPVSRFMNDKPITVERAISVADLVENFVYRYHHKLFPVVDNDRLVGCVTTRQIKELPREEWESQSVGAILQPCSAENTVAPDEDAMKAFARISRTGSSRLMVVEGDQILGILALKDLLQFFANKLELEETDQPIGARSAFP